MSKQRRLTVDDLAVQLAAIWYEDTPKGTIKYLKMYRDSRDTCERVAAFVEARQAAAVAAAVAEARAEGAAEMREMAARVCDNWMRTPAVLTTKRKQVAADAARGMAQTAAAEIRALPTEAPQIVGRTE